MQLLVTYQTDDRTAFTAAYGASAESRADAGLTQLQLWDDADNPGRILGLYTVNSRKKADDWLNERRAGLGLAGATIAFSAYLTPAGA